MKRMLSSPQGELGEGDEFEHRKIVKQMTEILSFMHTKPKMAHNDVKAENYLYFRHLPTRRNIKLADFDSACKFGETCQKKATPYVCSPELARFICSSPDQIVSLS